MLFSRFDVTNRKNERQKREAAIIRTLRKFARNLGDEVTLRNASTALSTDLAKQHQKILAAATSDNTRRAYRSSINHLLAWGGRLPCEEPMLIA
ncbi:hypothetical protein [Noviherbaspirillum malthae]|jgi:hypothetical protein|uniref:hypothetical protein n=1 Tax=Noviherbaspirillum malthae TaxID=1260987 RepID=UPI001890543F|nr:hypothetical protein [Noviherbaspirillum malthae]